MPPDLKVSTGTLLASAPDLQDPNFMHSLSVICEHTDEGAYGLVLNKRSSLTLDRLLPDHPILGKLRLPVGWGGPVHSDTLQLIHRFPESIPGGITLGGDLQIGGDLDAAASLLEADTSAATMRGVRFILGCAGWGGGQLEAELASGSWLPLPLDTGLVFRTWGVDDDTAREQEEVWQAAVRALGRDGEGLASLPPDIEWN
jgi:putative transcriptional regulator